MHLSKRLQAVADYVRSGGVVADIGCDHGFTVIFLVRENRAAGGIAMDINEGPLQRAKEHIADYGLSEKIQVRKSDGTQMLQPGEADTILISGIGGALMEHILRERPEVTASAKELVLSPQSEICKVRYALHDLGFQITQENMVYDMGKYYTILRCESGLEHYSSDIEYIYGKQLIINKHPVFCRFLLQEKKRVEAILAGMPEQTPAKENILQEQMQIETLLKSIFV
ncbi:MAG: SAM-dependent methyltransferase [Lachnospiraceae bacterium]|nr:SAM-dependent methyltransferase [Lachnospiraceae bacterium]